MAKVYLRSYRGQEIVDLPMVCIKCGAPATVCKSKNFSWMPSWVSVLIFAGLLPYVIVASLLTKRQRVATPLCASHKTYWWLFPMLLIVSVLGLLGLGFFAMIVMSEADRGRGQGSDLGGMVCGLTMAGLLVWLIAAVIINSMRIRPKEITDRYIHLTGVSQEFADAIEEEEERERKAFDREEDDRRPRRTRDDDDRYREKEDDPRYQR